MPPMISFFPNKLTAVQSSQENVRKQPMATYIAGQPVLYMYLIMLTIAEQSFREALKNPCCGGRKISWGRLLLNNLLDKIAPQ
jgi:hypothetical protein